MKKLYRVINLDWNDREPIAHLRMDGGECELIWYDSLMKGTIEDNGVRTIDGPVFPDDGQRFYDAVDGAYRNSSTILVTEDPDDEFGDEDADPVSDDEEE